MTTDELKNAIVALIVAGEKMEAALNQCNVRPHVLAEWRAVVREIISKPR
jgi:transposase-like protein